MITYKGCTISRTNTTTTVRRRIGNSLRTYEAYVPLYEVEGTVTKPHGRRPFLTSIMEAKEYISDEIAARTYGGL
jgi:hypothetical protein